MQPSPWTPTRRDTPTPVLLVEDDRRLAELVSDYLHEHGFAVQHVARGDLAGAACRQHAPELVVLDLMLPGLGGIDVCRQIRSFSDVPILMLTACEDDIEQVLGLESGADDYVHKPIEPRLLLARLRALLRRRHGSSNTGTPCRLMHGQLLIDRMQREVQLHGQPVELGTTEFEILWLLASQPGQILSRDQILQAVRGIGFDGLDRSVDVSIGKLRRKLGDDAREPRRIKTVWGRGYQFNPLGLVGVKRLFLRLWLVVAASFLVTLLLINVIFDRIYLPMQQRVFAEQVRGQLYALRQGLQGKDSAAQQQQLAQWQPHYGIALSLLPAPPALAADEQEQLQRSGMVSRQKFEIVLAPLDPLHADGPWLRLHLPGEPSVTLYLTLAAYSVMLALFGLCLYAWVRLLWRDLDALRVHADRIGAGDLQARAQVSPRSQIRVIVDHSNRMAARVAELVQRQRDLTHAISHELRTPIARVAFGLDLMQDSDDRERRARLAQGLHGDLAELNRLVSELLAYERLEHPSEGEPLQRIEANDWLQACLADARRDAERAGLALRVQPSALPRVDAEPRLLQLALSNLVGNALRHARSQVEVSLVGVGGRACLRVDDDGAGIAEADREKAMRPFTRLDDSRSRDTGGFGLGLAIVNRIAVRHGGELRISRASFGGARLEMHWPLAAS